MRNTNAKKKPNRILRRRGLAIALMLVVAIVATAHFGMEWALRQALEHYATRLNGAIVSVEDVRISLLQGRGSVHGVQITHHVRPMRNLLEIDEIRFRFQRRPLLSLKLSIPAMHIEGIRYNTPRERSGLPPADSENLFTTALLDRVAPAAYDPVRAALGQSPLRNLGLLSLGLGARNTVELMQREFESHQRLKSLEQELDRLLTAWDQAAAKLGAHQLENSEESELQRARTLLAKVEREYENLADRVEKIPQSIAGDTQRVLRRLGLPDLATEDFTRELLGRRTLNHLERLSYWVDLSRRRLGAGAGPGALAYPRAAGPLGTEVRFPTEDSLPRLSIRRVTLHSDAGENENQGNVVGTITDLSSEMGVDYRPLHVDLEAEFPGLRIFGLRMNALLDHGRKEPHDQVELSIGSFPLTDWTVEETPDLRVSMDSRVASLAFHSDFQGHTISADWTANVRNAEFSVTSRHRPLENTLKDIFLPLSTSISVSGSVSGTPSNLEFKIQSNIGRRLATAVGDRFRLPMHAAEEAIRGELEDRFAPAVDRLRARVRNGHTQIASRLLERIEELE